MYQENQRDYLNNLEKEPVDHAVATLVLGILALVTCIFYGIFSLIFGIIALAISARPNREYKASPELFDRNSYNQLNAGRICSIVAVSLSVLFWIIIIIAVMAFSYNLG